jgi:phosphate transport system permease protein
MNAHLMWRKGVNAVMLSVTAAFTLLAVSTLFLILGYLLYYGGRSLDWNFFTKLPLPTGEVGGGMANAIVGSAKIVGVAALIGLPIGFLAGVYLSEFEDKVFGAVVRYVADLLNGIPSIVVGILAWSLVVVPLKSWPSCSSRLSAGKPNSSCGKCPIPFGKAPWRWALLSGGWSPRSSCRQAAKEF